MRIILKILAAPTMCLLGLTVAASSLALLIAGSVCWLLVVAAGIGGVVLLLTHHPAGGIAFLVIAFLVSPYGLPTLITWMVGKMNALRCSLKAFLFS